MRSRTYLTIIFALLATLVGQCAGTTNPAPRVTAAPMASQVDNYGCGPEGSR